MELRATGQLPLLVDIFLGLGGNMGTAEAGGYGYAVSLRGVVAPAAIEGYLGGVALSPQATNSIFYPTDGKHGALWDSAAQCHLLLDAVVFATVDVLR